MNGVSRDQLRQERGQLDRLRGRYPEMTLLHGAELNIGRDGSVDYDEAFRRELDWCVAGVHSHFELDRALQTRRILARDGGSDGGRHRASHGPEDRPPCRYRGGHRRGSAESGRTNTAIEINAALGRLDASSEVLFHARDMPVTFVVSTDAHHTRELGRMEWGALHATRGWGELSRIANSWPRERFLAWLRERRSASS